MKKAAFFGFAFVLSAPALFAQNFIQAPINIQSALFVKVLAFNKAISDGGDVKIHVIGAPDFAAELRGAIGMAIGSAKLTAVTEGPDLPASKPSAIYLGEPSKLGKVLSYTKANRVLSMTGAPDLVPKGVTLGIGVGDGKPKVLLNLTSSKEEGIDWNPAILKVAATF